MAVNSPFFTKREPQTFSTRTTTTPGGLSATSSTLQSTPAASSSSDAVGARPVDTSSHVPEQQAATTEHGGSKLTVGPNIKLKGVEITDCDTLVVEGTVEATMDSRVIQITQQGAFHGSAEIDIAEIHGEFTGSLTVRQKLVIHSTGKVSGKIRYGKVVIEEGGQLSGEIEVGVHNRADKPSGSALKPAATQTVAAAA